MKIELYQAFDKFNVLRYVGIGQVGRHRHVNSGKSHSHSLNVCVAVIGNFDIHVEIIESDDKESLIKKAKKWEIAMIKKHGRLHLRTGTLLNRSKGGEETGWTADSKWYSSPDGKQSKRLMDDENIPFGWVEGRINMIGKTGWGTSGRKPPIRTGWTAWHDPATGEIKQINKSEFVPDGFIKGTGKNPIKDKKWYHDPATGEIRRFNESDVPKNFKRGRK